MTNSATARSTDVWSACMIDTRIVYGFLGAGKTSCIQDYILNDFFYKRGTTLILCFEEGEVQYDVGALSEKNTQVAYYDGGLDVAEFCMRRIEEVQPDRIYVEMNTMIQELREKLPVVMEVSYAATWIEWATLELYFANFRQMFSQMVSESHQVTFRGCPSKEMLAPYSESFRLMNRRATYLRQDPMGFHERAFDLFLPFSLEEKEITITESRFIPFWLDALEHPEHYEKKVLHFTAPLELRYESKAWKAGRVVMTCCMADLQFMSFELMANEGETPGEGWACFDALACTASDEYGRRVLKLKPLKIQSASAPKELILTPAGRS